MFPVIVCNSMIKYVATDPIICSKVGLNLIRKSIIYECYNNLVTLGTRSIPTLKRPAAVN